ncbi:MAG: hypothetical protein A3B37_02550 [Candidatus Sungbacteria bacterium RIFCSPLOWO2_01_FULL_59_16]|uniref:Uncharacterized protein n=1 Tax=Candidatus Sungbacteria bacterium RIFCSPLOWO2_01_FULL_59_16 TaxID=1802280 RepID=A0A1G2LAU7_9BACT|nr:MAG: hypothetical protein A3B37_02550 [Candidatus Sungbacteria bacterium RIFCSPLOWO2_01_FULL_59_16]
MAPAGGGGGQDCLGVILVELNVGFDMGIGDLVQDIGETIAAIPDAVADLANDAFSNGAELVKIVAGKIVAQTAVVKEFFAGRVAVLPGGDIVLPAGPDQIVGESVFPAGATSILVGNSRVASTTKVFLTPRAQLGAPFAVTELREGQGFVVSTSVAPASDVPFDWLIVTSYRVPADVAAGGSGGVTVISSGGTPSPSPPGIAGSDPAIVPAPPPAGGEMPGEMPSEPPPSEEPTFEPAPSEPAPELAPESPPPPAPIAEPQSPSTTPSPDTASQTSEEPSS